MKKHYLTICFDTDQHKIYQYSGLVTGAEENGKVYIDPMKIYNKIWGDPYLYIRYWLI